MCVFLLFNGKSPQQLDSNVNRRVTHLFLRLLFFLSQIPHLSFAVSVDHTMAAAAVVAVRSSNQFCSLVWTRWDRSSALFRKRRRNFSTNETGHRKKHNSKFSRQWASGQSFLSSGFHWLIDWLIPIKILINYLLCMRRRRAHFLNFVFKFWKKIKNKIFKKSNCLKAMVYQCFCHTHTQLRPCFHVTNARFFQ